MYRSVAAARHWVRCPWLRQQQTAGTSARCKTGQTKTTVVDFIVNTNFTNLPKDVQEKAQLTLIDTLGVISAGARSQNAARVFKFTREQHRAHPEAQFASRSLFQEPIKLTLAGTALANGQSSESMDAHDGFRPIQGSHVSAGIITAVTAVADSLPNLSGKDLLTALVIGQEVSCRFGMSIQAQTDDYIPSGLHNCVGAAAAASKLLGLTREQTEHALATAEIQAPRIQTHEGLRVTIYPTMLRDCAAWGAMSGVTAACLARDGFTGAPMGLEVADQDTLGSNYRMLELYCKPVPCCRWAIPNIALVRQFYAENAGLTWKDIESVRVETFKSATLLGPHILVPKTTDEIQYHVRWPVAAAMVRGDYGPNEADDAALKDEIIIRFCREVVTMVEKKEYTPMFPARTHSDLIITTKDGRTFGYSTMQNTKSLEECDKPINRHDVDLGLMDKEDLYRKYDLYAGYGMGKVRANKVRDLIEALPEASSTTELFDQLCKPVEPVF